MNTTSNEKSYFDLHTSGIGYVQRVREVPVRGGRRAQPFLACTIAALVGPARDPSYRYFDVKVSGAEAKKLVQRYIGVDDPKQRPLVRFRLGDLWGDAYIRDKGERKGEAAASLKARLLKAELIDRAEKWLAVNTITNPVLKWETEHWGEIPADFGRKYSNGVWAAASSFRPRISAWSRERSLWRLGSRMVE